MPFLSQGRSHLYAAILFELLLLLMATGRCTYG